MPSTSEIASGTETEIFSAPSWRFPPAPVSPSHDSSPESRTTDGRRQLLEEVAHAADERDEQQSSPSSVTSSAMPSTVSVAASPRDSPVFAITNRTGYSNTSPRKMPMKTIRNVSPIARNAATTPTAATTSSTVRIGRSSSPPRLAPCLAHVHRPGLYAWGRSEPRGLTLAGSSRVASMARTSPRARRRKRRRGRFLDSLGVRSRSSTTTRAEASAGRAPMPPAWRRRTGTRARTSTASSSRDPSTRSSATTSWSAARAT